MKKLNLVFFLMLISLSACGKKDENMVKNTGTKVGEGLTDFVKGVGQGIDQKMVVTTELSAQLTESGISKTISKNLGVEKGISVYLISTKAFKSSLIAKALDEKGQEVGRALTSVELNSDDAKYITFLFDKEMDTNLVKKYFIDIAAHK